MKQINTDKLNPRFEYNNNDERQAHLNKLLYQPGWVLTPLGGDGVNTTLFAEYSYEGDEVNENDN